MIEKGNHIPEADREAASLDIDLDTGTEGTEEIPGGADFAMTEILPVSSYKAE